MGCDDVDAPSDDAGERGGWGKAEAPGSCAPADCGGRASEGPCWCDAQCVDYNDCCSNKALVCDGAEPQSGAVVEEGPWAFADVFAPPNRDGYQAGELMLSADALATVEPGGEVQLLLSGDATRIRIWRGNGAVVGAGAGTSSYAFTPGGQESLLVEFLDYGAAGQLQIRNVRANNTVAAVDTVILHAAPMVLNHHLQPAEHVVAVGVDATGYNNDAFIAAYEQALGDKFSSVPGWRYGQDVWIQDEFEFATAMGPGGQRLDVVIDSIRDRGLDGWAEDALVAPGFVAETWGNPWTATSYDSFGNLEASPPVTVGGVEFPFGRIYYGTGLNSQLRTALAAQEVQAPFSVDTSWLCVGHVDEYSSFVPDPSSAKGFKFLIADVDAGLEILDSLPASMSLPMYGADHGYSTVGEMRSDVSLMALNRDIQDDYLDPIRSRFRQELGLTNADIIRVPSLFEWISGCGAGALVPGMVNLIVADAGGDTHLFVADPFFRASLGNQAVDPFIDAFRDLMPAGLRLHFVDNWDVYHLGIGEVHCGTNVIRSPQQSWWTEAAHLMGGI